MNNDELIAAGHELAKCLDSNTPLTEIAKLITRLATALDVTTLAVREATKQLDQVAQAVGWVEGGNFTLAETVGGHVSGLKAAAERSEELAAENAALKQSEKEFNNFCRQEYYGWEDNFTETPATDAFLREVRASAVDAACLKISKSIASCRQDEMIGLDEAVNIASDFATELRKGGAA